MEIVFIILLFIMLLFVGYAKGQQGVVRTVGTITFNEDEDKSNN